MKQTFILTLTAIILIAAATAQPSESPTVSFDPSQLTLAAEKPFIKYDDLSHAPISVGMDLPFAAYFIEIPSDGPLPTIAWHVDNRELVASLDPEKTLEDIVTSDDASMYAEVQTLRGAQRFGTEPVHVVEVLSRSVTRYVKLMIFPVTVEEDGDCYLNKSVTITVDSHPLSADDLLSQLPAFVDDFRIPDVSSASSAVEYLIVTSDSLLDAVTQFAWYKRSLGVNAEIEIIDDILSAFAGRDDAEKLRERFKQFYSDGGTYVLLAGDETILPVRYAYPYSTSTLPEAKVLQICDLYFADLTGDWDLDNDGIWGESYIDDVDLTPELIVGRLPFNTPAEIEAYTAKLKSYETNPGDGDPGYLERTFFFSSDQMRDYADGGQHGYIANAYPAYFEIDTANGVELSSGDDPSPYNLTGAELESVVSSGYGIVNVIAHGSNDAFGVRTTRYNEWPKSYFISYSSSGTHGSVTDLDTNKRVSFYYSLACDNGGFDMDQPPFVLPAPNLVQSLLGLENAGAVGFVANARWGWVSSSYKIHKAFFDSLFANPGRPAVMALYDAKAQYPYYRDQVYGLNFFGDPAMKVYTEIPKIMACSTSVEGDDLVVTLTADGQPVHDCDVIFSQRGVILSQARTGHDGRATINYDLELNQLYDIAAPKSGYATGYVTLNTTVITDVEEYNDELPRDFALSQNYPNPFNPSTTIEFQLASRTHVTLTVYNLLGQAVAVLKDESLPAGTHYVEWHGDNISGGPVASGIYLYRIDTEDFSAVRKMVLLR